MSTMSTNDDKTYNGWANYPTWAVHLWLTNDEELYHQSIDLVGESGGPDLRITIADAFKAWVRDDLTPDLGASFSADLLGYALDQVDWLEIADSFLEQ